MIRTQKWSHKWGIPGGKIKRGESAEAALVRELKEETNLDVRAVQFVQLQDCIDPEEFYRSAHFVLLNYRCRTRGTVDVVVNDEGEAFQWVGLTEALGLDLNAPTRRLLEELQESS